MDTTTRNIMSHPDVYVTDEGLPDVQARQVWRDQQVYDTPEDVSDFSDFESDEYEDPDAYDVPCEDDTVVGGPVTDSSGLRRQRVKELVATEIEYVNDLNILTEVTLGDATHDRCKVLNMKVLLGNIAQVIDVARRFLQGLTDVAQCKEEEMVLGKVFLQFVEQLTKVYKVYCSAYNVDVLPLIKKYESEENTAEALKQIAEELRSYKRHLLDLNCVLIKPVQRFLKYPLYLEELVSSTPENHVDYKDLQAARKSFQSAARDINEYTRAIDLVHKYREYDDSLHGKIRRMNLRSLARKSFRVTTKLSQKLGVVVKSWDAELGKLESQFQTVQKTAQNFVKDVIVLLEAVRHRQTAELVIAESLVDIFCEDPLAVKVKETALESCNRVLQMFDNEVEQRSLHPAKQIVWLCDGPANLIQKTHTIMLDYDGAQVKLQAALEPSRIAATIEESAAIRATYDALSSQLIAELPVFIKHSMAVLTICSQSLVSARMYLQGHLTKLYLTLAQEPGLGYITPEEAKERAKRQVEHLMQQLPPDYQKKQLAKKKDPIAKMIEKSENTDHRLKTQEPSGETSKSSSSEFFKNLPTISKGRSRRSYPLNTDPNAKQSPKEPRRVSAPYDYFKSWSPSGKSHPRKSLFALVDPKHEKSQKKALDKMYPRENLYIAAEDHSAKGDNELTLCCGDMVAVLKKKDPMGGEGRWVTDNGERIGLVRAECLKLAEDYRNGGERRSISRSFSVRSSKPILKSMSLIPDSSFNYNSNGNTQMPSSHHNVHSTLSVPGFSPNAQCHPASVHPTASSISAQQAFPTDASSITRPASSGASMQQISPGIASSVHPLSSGASMQQVISPEIASSIHSPSSGASMQQVISPEIASSVHPLPSGSYVQQVLPSEVPSSVHPPSSDPSVQRILPSDTSSVYQRVIPSDDEYSDSSDEWDLDDDGTILHDLILKEIAAYEQEHPDTEHQTNVQEQKYVALYNFKATESNQIDLTKGQVLVGIHTEYDDWWYVKDDSGNHGYVPASYLERQQNL